LGHKRTTYPRSKSTVVRFGQKADKRKRNWIVRFVPEADITTAIRQILAARSASASVAVTNKNRTRLGFSICGFVPMTGGAILKLEQLACARD
jgi:hypothetical protein